MIQYKVTDYELREAVKKLSEDEVEGLIKRLSVSHTMFKNWLEEKDKLFNSKTRNMLRHELAL